MPKLIISDFMKNNSKPDPLFSILIANYNNGNFITETIESIQKQTYENYEVIIVDDSSTDQSISVIENLMIKDSRIKLFINENNEGCGYTKMKCVEFAAGDFCGFVDPEDTLSNEAIEKMVSNHENYPNASIVFSNYFHCNESLNILSLKKPGFKEGIIDKRQLYDRRINHFTSFKRKLYFKTDQINPRLKRAVDQDLYIKLEEVGDVVYIDDNLYYYRYHRNGISAFGNNYKALYWYFIVKKETCERRNINQEDFFSEEYEKLVNNYKDTMEYKVGNCILSPIKVIRSGFYRFSKLILNR